MQWKLCAYCTVSLNEMLLHKKIWLKEKNPSTQNLLTQTLKSHGEKKMKIHPKNLILTVLQQLTVSGGFTSVNKAVLLFPWSGSRATTRCRDPVDCWRRAMACWWEMFWSNGVQLMASMWSFSLSLWSLNKTLKAIFKMQHGDFTSGSCNWNVNAQNTQRCKVKCLCIFKICLLGCLHQLTHHIPSTLFQTAQPHFAPALSWYRNWLSSLLSFYSKFDCYSLILSWWYWTTKQEKVFL